MKTVFTFIITVWMSPLINCQTPIKDSNFNLLIGTYTQPGKSEGIYVYRFNAETGESSYRSEVSGIKNPSYLTVSKDRKYVYSVNVIGNGNGGASAFSFDPASGKIDYINSQSSGGNGPCYISVDDQNKFAFVGNYSGGSLAAIPINHDGSLGSSRQSMRHGGSSIAPNQERPHIHATVLSPDDRFLFVPDLGTDKVNIYKVDLDKPNPLTSFSPDQAERVETDLFNEGSGNLPLSGNWESWWTAVNLANTVIASAATAQGDQILIGRIVGEAKFIRASFYFYMVNIWGGLPLRTEPTDDFSKTIMPRSSVEVTYNLIVQDLTEAAEILPNSYNGSTGNEIGRATRGAALTLLGKAELQRSNKTAAEKALRQVLGKYSLLPNFADIHSPGNDNTQESIYEINFNPADQTGWNGNNSFIPNSVAIEKGIIAGGSSRRVLSIYPTQDLIESFDSADLRVPNTFDFATTGNYIGPYISKFIDVNASSTGSDINFVMLRYADVLLMLAESIGESGEAYDLINQVRSRAGLPDIDTSSHGTFIEKILNERRWEFAFELHRWIDLLRLLPDSEVISIMETQLKAQQLNKFGLNLDISLTKDNLLYPIPQIEIDVSDGVVEQNPRY